jgi:hypothetical protein
MKRKQFALGVALALCGGIAAAQSQITVVDRPAISGTNSYYIGNRTPLEPSRLLPLPIGAVQPKGWLRAYFDRQRDGLSGHLGEISVWLQKDDNAWLSKNGKGKYGWEELPYWLRGYIQLAYILDDPKMTAESQVWIEGALASQRPDGDFGPDQKFDDDGSRDFWANMLMMYSLETYYEHTHDARVINLMTKYFKYQLSVPDAKFLTHYWQKMRGGDNLYSVYWLYNRTGDPFLLELASKIHRCTADWEMKDDLPNWHNVNIAEAFREPATHYLQTHDAAELKDTRADFNEVRKRYGQVPGGMFGGDENCRPGYSDPRQAIETCGMVEQMFSDELLEQISGDPSWADNCEDVAFNSYPAALTPDMRALRYLTAPNMVNSDAKNHSPGIQNAGPFLVMNPFSARCCQHNHSMGWPYFARHLWLATPDNGLCAALYSASEVRAQAGDGEVRITEDTHYPFDETLRFTVHAARPVSFPLYLRIPGWCQGAAISLNGKPQNTALTAGQYARIERQWKEGDVVTLTLPMRVSVRRWTDNHDSASVNYGPLTFSLKIGERYQREDSTRTAIGDSGWQKTADPSKWPAFEIFPTTPWNYGLVLNAENPDDSFKVKKLAWPRDDFPFTPDSAPIEMVAKARRIPQWTLDRYGLCATLQDSPAASGEPTETVTLVPMGAARLRISAFPVIGSGPGAHQWTQTKAPQPPLYKASASHVFENDSVDALCDGLTPANSNDQEIPRFTWWPRRGSAEWVQYDFSKPRDVSAVSVYWFDDTGVGQCRVPQSWKLLYQDGAEWKPVESRGTFGTARDEWNGVEFAPVQTTALRVEAQLQPEFSGGILEWKVNDPVKP